MGFATGRATLCELIGAMRVGASHRMLGPGSMAQGRDRPGNTLRGEHSRGVDEGGSGSWRLEG